MSDRTELIARLAPGYVECVYADAERGTDDGARKAISKEGLNGTVEVGLFLPDRPGVQLMYGPVIWLCLESVARDLRALRGPNEEQKLRDALENVVAHSDEYHQKDPSISLEEVQEIARVALYGDVAKRKAAT